MLASKGRTRPPPLPEACYSSRPADFAMAPMARGASGPDLIRSFLVSHDVGGNLIGPVVHNGRPEKGMPAFQLTDVQIREIVDHLHSEAKLASSITRGKAAEYPIAKLLLGNAQEGKTYFNGKGNAQRATRPPATWPHVATKYKPIDLQARIAYPSGAAPTLVVVAET